MPGRSYWLHYAGMKRIDQIAIEAQIQRCEAELHDAIVRGDTQVLDRLLSDELIFINQDGRFLSKADDLDAHRSGLLRINSLEKGAERIRLVGEVAIVTVEITLAGSFSEHPFAGRFAYTRVWGQRENDWRIESAHCSSIVS